MSASKRPADEQDHEGHDGREGREGQKRKRQRQRFEVAKDQPGVREKVRAVLERELAEELRQREADALLAQERIHQVQRTLHLLRYAVVSDYYRRVSSAPPAAVPGTPDDARQILENAEKQGQALHPAVKKLLGKNAQLPTFDNWGLRNRPKRSAKPTATVTSSSAAPSPSPSSAAGPSTAPKGKLPSGAGLQPEAVPLRVPRYIPPKGSEKSPPSIIATSSRVHRRKAKKRLVVGNISKWLAPELREDAATHKWMMYVRGPRQSPDVSDFISRVRFFLHPSYRPFDVVDVDSSPFHLTRRGWGEFPVRVQIHFSAEGNRPVEVIHPLKLDRTCSGLQMLGAETVVDVWLMAPEEREGGSAAGETDSDAKWRASSVPEDKGRLLYSDGEHNTVAHDESVTMLTMKFKQEPEEDSKDVPVNGAAPHLVNDHDYLGLPSPQRSRSSSPLLTPENELARSQRSSPVQDIGLLPQVRVKQEPWGAVGAAPMTTSLVKCKNSQGEVFFISLHKPKPASALIKDPSGEASVDAEDKRFVQSLLRGPKCNRGAVKPFVMKNGLRLPQNQVKESSMGRSLLKKNCASLPVKTEVASQPKQPSPCASALQQLKQSHFGGRTLKLGKLHAKNTDLLFSIPKEDLIREAAKVVGTLRGNPEEALTWLMRQLPLADQRVEGDRDFRRTHYYCAESVRTFLAWLLPKQRAAEWMRAKAAQRILRGADVATGRWSTRHIVQWGRLHGLTPLPPARPRVDVSAAETPGPSQKAGKALLALPIAANSTLSEPSDVLDWLAQHEEEHRTVHQDADDEVDVVSEPPLFARVKKETEPERTDVSSGNRDQLCLPSSAALGGFVCDSARLLGIRLEPEQLAHGVLYPAAERLVLRGMLSFCEDVIRRSARRAWTRCGKQPEQITPGDVRDAVLSRPEFSLLSSWGLGVKEYSEEDITHP